MTGTFRRANEKGEYKTFRYEVVRLWELPCEPLLSGPPGLIPLALLTDDARPRLPDLLRRADERFATTSLPPGGHEEMLTACHILMGLRYDSGVVQQLFRSLRTMRESCTYMAILDEGRQEGRHEGELHTLHQSITRMAAPRLGEPSADEAERLASVTDNDRLWRLMDRVLTAADWHDLLATP